MNNNYLTESINITTSTKININTEFLNYVINNCKYLLSYDTKKINFKLQSIGNINIILSNLQNTNKRLSKQLAYNIHKKKFLNILDTFTLLMLNKGYRYDFINYIYILYEFKNDKNEDDEKLYFIKMKANNMKSNSMNKNTINQNFNLSSEGETYIMFILHNNTLFFYLY